MTLEEACEVLGVSPDDSPSVARRAYMKAVRAHSPERDPAGFQRVRSAYELFEESRAVRDLFEEADPRLNEESAAQEILPSSPSDVSVAERPELEPVSDQRLSRWNGYFESISREQLKRAAELAIEILGDASVPPIEPALLLRHYLLLERDGHKALAWRLYDALLGRVEADGTTLRAFEECFELWAVVREFRSLGKRLEAPFRGWIAGHLAIDPWTETLPSWAWLQEEHPRRLKDLRRVQRSLKGAAPALHGILSRGPDSSFLSWRETDTGSDVFSPGWWKTGGWAFAVFLIGGLRLLPSFTPDRPNVAQRRVQEELVRREAERTERSKLLHEQSVRNETLAAIDQAQAKSDCAGWREQLQNLRKCSCTPPQCDDVAFAAEQRRRERHFLASCDAENRPIRAPVEEETPP